MSGAQLVVELTCTAVMVRRQGTQQRRVNALDAGDALLDGAIRQRQHLDGLPALMQLASDFSLDFVLAPVPAFL